MKKYSNCKEINGIVKTMIKLGWHVRTGKKHHILVSPFRGLKVSIPSSPSDRYAANNFNRDINRILKRQGV